MQLWDDMVSLVQTPFIGGLDIKHLFLLIGLVLVFIAAWIFILEHIRSAAMEIID